MNFQDLMEKDLDSCNDMGETCKHYFNETDEELEYLYFDKNTEVIFDSDSDFNEVEAKVPSVVFANHKITNINHKSKLEFDGKLYHIVSIQDENAGTTTRVYLGI